MIRPNLSIIFEGMSVESMGRSIFLICLSIIYHLVMSQPDKFIFYKAGLNLNNQLNAHFKTTNIRPGVFATGGMLVMGKIFGSGLEASYVQRYASWDTASTTVDDRNEYIDIGVSIRAGKKMGNHRLFITGGMVLSFWMSARRYVSTPNTEYDMKLKFPQARSSLDVGMYLGLEYSWKKLFFELRTFQGLVDISNTDYDVASIYNQGISAGIGYRFQWKE